MVNEEARLKEEFGGMLVNLRKPGEAVVIGADIAVMVVRVAGQQVRIGVASKTKQTVMREEVYRQKLEERAMFGKPTFQQFYRGYDAEGPVYSLTHDDEDFELVTTPDALKGEDYRVTILRFHTLLEVQAIKNCIMLIGSECKVSIAELAKRWLIMIVKPGAGPGYLFEDYTIM